MYESHFGFARAPFSVAPQVDFMYPSRQHRMALSLLRYGLVSGGLISVLTGEIGAGKTTLVRYVTRYLRGDVSVGLVTNTGAGFGELMQWILLAFGLDYRGKDKVEMFQAFQAYLRDEHAGRRRAVLIVDEAQNLALAALDELRMLSNLNADGFRPLHMIIAGQPQLRDLLRRSELAQFAQRVTVDFHLKPLELDETAAYIDHRVEVAGRTPAAGLFDARAVELIHVESGGVPRLVNLLCDKTLVYAYAAQRAAVEADLVEELLRDKRAQGGWLFQQPTSASSARPASMSAEVPGSGMGTG